MTQPAVTWQQPNSLISSSPTSPGPDESWESSHPRWNTQMCSPPSPEVSKSPCNFILSFFTLQDRLTELPLFYLPSMPFLCVPWQNGNASHAREHSQPLWTPTLTAMGGHCTKPVQLLESELGFLEESFPQALIPLSLAQLLRTSQPSKAQPSPKASGICERRDLLPLWVFTSPGLQHSGQLWRSWSSQPDPLPKAVPALRNTTAECWGAFPLGEGKGSSWSLLTRLWHGVLEVSWSRGSAVTQFISQLPPSHQVLLAGTRSRKGHSVLDG